MNLKRRVFKSLAKAEIEHMREFERWPDPYMMEVCKDLEKYLDGEDCFGWINWEWYSKLL